MGAAALNWLEWVHGGGQLQRSTLARGHSASCPSEGFCTPQLRHESEHRIIAKLGNGYKCWPRQMMHWYVNRKAALCGYSVAGL